MRSKTPELTLEKERTILDAAQKRFALYGVGKVTMDEIAADLGMAKGTMYYYFPTKADVFRKVVAREQDAFISTVEEVVSSSLSAGEKLQRYQNLRQQLFHKLFNINQLSRQGWGDVKPVMRSLYEVFERREAALVTKILRGGKSSGEFSLSSPEKAATFFLHALHGLRMRVIRSVDAPPVALQHVREYEQESCSLIEVFLAAISKSRSIRSERKAIL